MHLAIEKVSGEGTSRKRPRINRRSYASRQWGSLIVKTYLPLGASYAPEQHPYIFLADTPGAPQPDQ